MEPFGQIELQLFHRYTAEVAEIVKKIDALDNRRIALVRTITGLKLVLAGLGINPDAPQEIPEVEEEESEALEEEGEGSTSVMDDVVKTLQVIGLAGAKEIQNELLASNRVINYYTLVKTLNREAAKSGGRITRNGRKFELRLKRGSLVRFGPENFDNETEPE